MVINRHPEIFNLISAADAAFERGEVELPIDYIDAHFQEFADSDKLYEDIQDIYESRIYR